MLGSMPPPPPLDAEVLLVRLSVVVLRRDLVVRLGLLRLGLPAAALRVREIRSVTEVFELSHSNVLVSLFWLISPDEICLLTVKVSKTGDQGPSMLFKFPPQSASQQGRMFKNMGSRESCGAVVMYGVEERRQRQTKTSPAADTKMDSVLPKAMEQRSANGSRCKSVRLLVLLDLMAFAFAFAFPLALAEACCSGGFLPVLLP
mmetsp:Transcript_116672/g.174209  ORF Transcript_116672/g.174209 Transcript_116672/m.174209 type:complete len:203 (+) Transcript_116672:662-1270(+)